MPSQRFYFEIFEAIRKIALVGLPVFFPPFSSGQLVFGLMVCFLSFGAYGAIRPYNEPSDNTVSNIAQLHIFLCAAASFKPRLSQHLTSPHYI